jgi:hypothetical protein
VTLVRVRGATRVGLLVLTTAIATTAVACGDATVPSASSGPSGSAAGLVATPSPAASSDGAPSSSDDLASDSASPTLPLTGESAEPTDGEDLETPEPQPGDPFGAPDGSYHQGFATITVGPRVISLDRLAAPGTFYKEFGADVVWNGPDGWYLQIGEAKPSNQPVEFPAYIAIDWVHDGQHWISWDPSGCRITIDQADRAGIRGTASCSQLVWVDAIVGGLADEPTPIPGQAPFSAEITFRANP